MVDFSVRKCYKKSGCVRIGALGRRGGCSVAGSDARTAVYFLPHFKAIFSNHEQLFIVVAEAMPFNNALCYNSISTL